MTALARCRRAGESRHAHGVDAEVTKTVRNLRNEIRANFNPIERRTEGVATNGVVRAEGGAWCGRQGGKRRRRRSARGQAGQVREKGAKAPTTVVKGFRDTARQVDKEVRQAAKDVREAA